MPFATSTLVIGGHDSDATRVDDLDLIGFTAKRRCALRDTIGDDQITALSL